VTGKPPGNPTAAIGVGLALLLLAMIAFSQLPKGGSDAGDAQQRLEDFRRQQKRKAVAVALAGAPNPPPDPKDEKEIERSVRELGVDKARFESLARDPAIGWRIDESTIAEARIALRLEGKGQLHDVVRSPDPAVDLIEDGGAGQSWDVKSYRADGFDLTRTLAAINDELQAGHRVIINTAHLSRAQVIQLEKFVDLQPWGGRILFATSE
jgi:hypothetical protein